MKTITPQEPRRFRVSKVIAWICVILLVLILLIGIRLYTWATSTMRDVDISPQVIFNLIFDGGAELKGTEGRTNLLLLGISGGDRDGARLTDTILVASFKQNDGSLSLLSLPRDIWSDTLKDKINSAYYYGEEKKQGGGVILSRAIMEEVVGFPIHYVLLVDFAGFEKIIDQVGGIDVEVSEGFTDPEFPILGKENDLCEGDVLFLCRYETIIFESGLQHMDGKRALAYVRSRHATGSEGNDFARGRRQQEVILSLKAKLMDVKTWWPPEKGKALYLSMIDAMNTDMTIGEILTYGKLVAQAPKAKTFRIDISDQLTEGPLWQYSRYVLVPKQNFDELHGFIKTKLEGK